MKQAFIRVGCLGISVLRGGKDTVIFNAGEVITVYEEFEKTINTITADGVNRTVSKEFLNVFEDTTDFLSLEDASDIVAVGMKLFLAGKSVWSLPMNSIPVFQLAWNVVQDHFTNTVFDGTDT